MGGGDYEEEPVDWKVLWLTAECEDAGEKLRQTGKAGGQKAGKRNDNSSWQSHRQRPQLMIDWFFN